MDMKMVMPFLRVSTPADADGEQDGAEDQKTSAWGS